MTSTTHAVFQVSEHETNLRVTVDRVEVFDVVNEACMGSSGGCSVKSVESVLPPFPVLLSETVQSTYPRSSHSFREEATTVNSRNPSSVTEPVQRRLLLRVTAADTAAARIAVNLQQAPGMNAGTGWKKSSRDMCSTIELKAYLQPIVLFLDVYALKRIAELLTASTLRSCENQGQAGKCPLSPEKTASGKQVLDQMLVDLDKRCEESAGNSCSAATSGKQSWECALEASLFTPCIRVIVGFPAVSERRVDQLRDDVVAFDVTMPASKVGMAEPLLAFKHAGKVKKTSGSQFVDSLSFSFGDGVIYLIGSGEGLQNSCTESCHSSDCGPRVDRIARFSANYCEWENAAPMHADEQGSLDVKWFNQEKAGAWLAKRAWDAALAQQKRADAMGGSNSEFASATAAEFGEEDNLQLREDIVSCSSAVIHLKLPCLRINLSGSQHMLVYELLSSFMDILSVETPEAAVHKSLNQNLPPPEAVGGTGPSSASLQTSFLVECGHVNIALHPFSTGASDWDILTGQVENLRVLFASQMGGRPDVSFFWLQLEECQINGSFPDAQSTTLTGESDLLLFSCRRVNLGRGDGGEGNALAPGAAGISVTHMAWPGRDRLADLLLIASMRGATFVAHSGRLDWISALVAYFTESAVSATAAVTEATTDIGTDLKDTADYDKGNRIIRLFDLHDVALCYEPGKEVLLLPGARVSISSCSDSTGDNRRLLCSPVACVLAAAAVRVSSSPGGVTCGDPYDIWFRDTALHVLNTNLRKLAQQDYSLESMQCTGYRQVGVAHPQLFFLVCSLIVSSGNAQGAILFVDSDCKSSGT